MSGGTQVSTATGIIADGLVKDTDDDDVKDTDGVVMGDVVVKDTDGTAKETEPLVPGPDTRRALCRDNHRKLCEPEYIAGVLRCELVAPTC